VVSAVVAYLCISAGRVTRQAIGEMRGVHALQGAPNE
jgi:hypothetical protein